MDRTATVSPEETSLNNIGFAEDANAEETASNAGVATEEAEHAEEVPTEEQAEESREEGAEEAPEEEAAAGSEEENTEATDEEAPHGYDMLLPNQQQKVYPDELHQLAIKKFGLDQLNLSEEQLASKQFRSFVKGKIDSDIEIRRLHDELDTGAEDDTIVDEEQDAPAAAREEVAITPERQLEATHNFLRGGIDGQTPILTKAGAKMYSEASLAAYTEMQEALESNDPKKIEAAQMKYTESQAAFATVMFANVLPALLPQMIQNLPPQLWDGIVGGKLEEREEMKENHKSAREELMKDPRYADLKEMIESKAVYNYVRDNPEILQKNFVDANNRPITDPVKLNMARYRHVVHQIRGQNYRPATELVKKGMDAGKRQANAMAEKKANGRLATGRTRGSLGSSQDPYETGNWVERQKRAAANSDPLGTFLNNSK